MNEINSMTNTKDINKKKHISNKIKNLKQNFHDINYNKYNPFRLKLGNTTKNSPINCRNKIIGYVYMNKTNLYIPKMISKVNKNKNITLENNKRNNKHKSNKKKKKKNSQKQSRNIKKNLSKFNKINLNKKNNYIHSISLAQNSKIKTKDFFDNKERNSSINKPKKNIINKPTIRKEKNNKYQRNLQNNIKNSNSTNISYLNLFKATKHSPNLKVMKIINNIYMKKKKNDIKYKKYSNSVINSRKNTNSKEKKDSKNKNNNTYNTINNKKIFNIFNKKVIQNIKKKKSINLIRKKIISNIFTFTNDKMKNKYQNLITEYPKATKIHNRQKKNNNYSYLKSEDFPKTSINIKNKQININNNHLLNSYTNHIIKISSEKNSRKKEKTKININNKIYQKKTNNNNLNKYKENLDSNLNYKLFPLTSTQTKYARNNNYSKNIKNKTKSKSNKIRKNRSQSNPKDKKRNKSNKKYNDNNNIYLNRYSVNEKKKTIISITKNFNKKTKFEKKYNNINRKNYPIKRNSNNTNNFIINICQSKSVYPESSLEYKKIKRNINLTISLLQSNSKNKTTLKNKNKNISNQSIKKYDSNNIFKDDSQLIINNKDSHYYNEISEKLSKKIKKYGKEHNYSEYPKTDLSFYIIGRSIGHGAFGKVNLALHVLSGHIVSIKSFNKKKNLFPLNKIKNEVKIMSKLRKSDNIVKLFEIFETKDYYCLVMENVVGGNLLNTINKMNKIPENLSKIIFKQLITTLKYMHTNNIVHRDIKPDNILLDLDNTIKLCDFGVSKIIPQGHLINDSCGTPAFIAPEILKGIPYNPYLTDIWSSGVVLYVMITGFFPFRGINETQLHESILSGIYPMPKDISVELSDLLSRILNIVPENRISLDGILEHPWLNDDINKSNKNKDFNLNLFTKAEKIIYGKLKINYKKTNIGIQLENFTNKNIDSFYEEENQNVQTMSIVFTPYNSNREKDEDEDLYYDDVIIEDDIMKFTPKIQEINRLYEIHNNYDFDQGYIIDNKEFLRKKLKVSIKNSFEIDKGKDIIKSKFKKELSSISNDFLTMNTSINKDRYVIDEEAIKYVENFGYKKEYIIKSIGSNEMNHATATYYLKLSLKK